MLDLGPWSMMKDSKSISTHTNILHSTNMKKIKMVSMSPIVVKHWLDGLLILKLTKEDVIKELS